MTNSISPAIIVCVSAFFLFTVFVLYRLLATSEYPHRARFKKLFYSILALFFLMPAYYIFLQRPAKDKIRLAVFPLIDFSFSDDDSWLGWAISDHATTCLDKMFSQKFSFYPPEWVWEAMDPDSTADPNYLVDYAHRLKLDYVLIGGMHADCMACPIDWQWIDVKRDSAVMIRKTDLLLQNEIGTGQILAQEIGRYFNNQTFINPVPPSASCKYVILTQRALACQKFETALNYAQQAFNADSTNVPARTCFARAHLEWGIYLKTQGRPAELNFITARHTAVKTLDLDGTSSEIHRIIGKVHILNEFWGKAEISLTKALHDNPQNFRVYADLANLHMTRLAKLGFKNEAELYQKAISINPCFVEGRLSLANYYYFNQFNDSAEKTLNDLLYIYPRCLDGLLLFGKMAIAGNDEEKIVRVYDRILSIDPHNAIAYYNLGTYFYNSGDLLHAEQSFTNAVKYGNYADAHLYLGQIYEQKGLMDHAIEEYRLRIRLKKGIEDPYLDQARNRLYQLTHDDATGIVVK